MAITGDRQAASLLSALAEAPYPPPAPASRATQLGEMGGAGRVVILRLDAAQESFVTVAANELADAPAAAIPVSDLGNPLVIAALSLSPVVGRRPLPAPFASFSQWTALPMQ